MKRVLITGGCGFVGRAFALKFNELGWMVHLIDNLSSGRHPTEWMPLEANYTFWHGDVRNFCRVAAQTEFDLVIHLAAIVGGRLTIDGDPLRVAMDLSIDAEFFNWAVKVKPKKVVYFSSSAVYPIMLQRKGQNCALSESFVDFKAARIGMPDQTYGFAKFAGEYLAQVAAKKYNLDVVCYRPFSGYSEDQSTDYPFPAILKRVLGKENPLIVWGSGEQQRDFIHIDDCVDGVFATMDKLMPGEALNLGTGRGVTFKQLATMAGAAVGRHVNVQNDPSKPEGVFSRVCDPWKLNQWFKPKISLEVGIKRALGVLDRTSKVS